MRIAPSFPAPASRRALPLLLLAGLGLAGCGTNVFGGGEKTPPPPCPRVVTVGDAARLTRFNGAGRDLTDVSFEARIGDLAGSCVYDDDKIGVTLQVQFIASRGPANPDRRAPFNYFVAIAEANQQVLARETFDSVVEFPGNQTRAGVVEELEEEIPLKQGKTGADYVIYVGFQLTPEELQYNRQHPH